MLLTTAPVLALLLLSAPIQDSGRVPIRPAGEATAEEIARLTVSELLAAMPDDPWSKEGEVRELKPIPAEIRRRVESGTLSDDDWQRLILDGGVIHTRASWPAGSPLVAWVRRPVWLWAADVVVRAVRPDLGEVAARYMVGCGQSISMLRHIERAQAFGALPPGTTDVELEVSIQQTTDRETWFDAGTFRTLWRGRVRMPVRAVGSVEEAMPSTSDRRVKAAIRRSVTASLWGASNKPKRLVVRFGGDYEEHPDLRGVAVSLVVELRRSGVAIDREEAVVSSCVDIRDEFGLGLVGGCQFNGLPEELSRDDADLAGWELVLTGQPKDVLPIWEASRWWKGRISIPLVKLVNAERK